MRLKFGSSFDNITFSREEEATYDGLLQCLKILLAKSPPSIPVPRTFGVFHGFPPKPLPVAPLGTTKLKDMGVQPSSQLDVRPLPDTDAHAVQYPIVLLSEKTTAAASSSSAPTAAPPSLKVWVCSTCTCENNINHRFCSVCEEENPTSVSNNNSSAPSSVSSTSSSAAASSSMSMSTASASVAAPPTPSTGWSCSACTLVNSAGATKCSVCDNAAPPAPRTAPPK